MSEMIGNGIIFKIERPTSTDQELVELHCKGDHGLESQIFVFCSNDAWLPKLGEKVSWTSETLYYSNGSLKLPIANVRREEE